MTYTPAPPDDGADRPAGPLTGVRIRLQVIGETDRAWHVHDGEAPLWLPKSVTTRHDDGTLSMPLWLAKQEGL